jgi:hypothetical protein
MSARSRNDTPVLNSSRSSETNASQTCPTPESRCSYYTAKAKSGINSSRGAQKENAVWKVCLVILAQEHKPNSILNTFAELELGFFLAGVLHVSERRAMEGSRDDKHSEDEEDDDPSSRMRSAATSSNTRAPKNIRRSSQKDDDDSDFEFDL